MVLEFNIILNKDNMCSNSDNIISNKDNIILNKDNFINRFIKFIILNKDIIILYGDEGQLIENSFGLAWEKRGRLQGRCTWQ
jgi:hypothetical protein